MVTTAISMAEEIFNYGCNQSDAEAIMVVRQKKIQWLNIFEVSTEAETVGANNNSVGEAAR